MMEKKPPYWRGTTEEIVISGISGRFPESENIAEFAEHLMKGDDMVTENDRRWKPGTHGLPRRHGKLLTLNKFDAAYFGVSPKQAHNMDPQLRILLEVTHEAILDAGVDPQSIRGSRTGVFIGASGSETSAGLTRDPDTIAGYELTGCAGAMFANRVSYSFDFRGPSFPVDTACSSGLLALQLAVDSLRADNCDMAIVAGTSLTLTPHVALQFLKLGMLSAEGRSRSFDIEANGYVRSEAVCAIFLQKSSVARRVYSTVVHAKSSTDGYKEGEITVPSGEQQAVLLKRLYKEAGVHPNQVVYLEAHGTGTPVGDPQECHGIAEVFCTDDREEPLLIGSVKSNMGHAEPASGMCSLAKVLIAMESGTIPGNLHFNEPNSYIPALLDGRMKVVDEPTPLQHGYIGINSFGFGGANTHVLLKPPTKLLNIPQSISESQPHPTLICFSGRSDEGVRLVLEEAAIKRKNDKAYHHLVSQLANLNAQQNHYRGYALFNRMADQEPIIDVQKVHSTDGVQRPVWYIYSGMGSQWTGMARELLQIPVFAQSILQSSEILRPQMDLYSLLANEDETPLKDVMQTIVCITAIQLALTDLLASIGVSPSGIIGHSTGEMVSAYADGCLTRNQTLQIAKFRGESILQSGLPGTGAMAAVGLSWDEAKRRVPDGVVIACHNAEDSVTISGDTNQVQKLVDKLKHEDIFAKLVDSGGVPFHSPGMAVVKDKLLVKFKNIIPEPIERSERWISSSVSKELQGTDVDKYCSADYHINNILSPVLFHNALSKVPENAVVIEIGPTALLQSILKRALPKCSHIGLCKSKQASELEYLLSSIGRLHQTVVPVTVMALADNTAEFPVPRGTPMLSPLIKWDHAQDWHVIIDSPKDESGATSYTIDPFSTDSTDAYLLDHVIDGRALFPFTGYILLAWKAICKMRNCEWSKTPVLLHSMEVHKATIMAKAFKLDVAITPGDGRFQILDNSNIAASGIIEVVDSDQNRLPVLDEDKYTIDDQPIMLRAGDMYKELLLRGYDYAPFFQGLYTANQSGTQAVALWKGNWVTFLDALLQTTLLAHKEEHLKLPVTVRRLLIDPIIHQQSIVDIDDKPCVIVNCNIYTKQCVAGGVYMCEPRAQTAVKRSVQAFGKLQLEKVHFVPHMNDNCATTEERVHLTSYAASVRHHIASACDRAKNCTGVNGITSELTQLRSIVLKDVNNNDSIKTTGPLTVLFDQLYQEESKSKDGDMRQLILDNMSSLKNDPLYTCSLTQRSVKPLIDIAMENTPGHMCRYTSINAYDSYSVYAINRMAITHPMLETQWTLLGVNVDKVFDEEFMLKADAAMNKVEKTSVDLDSDADVPEALLGSSDVLVLDRVLRRSKNVQGFLCKLKRLLREDGFAIVIENTDGYELTLLIDALTMNADRDRSNENMVYGIYYRHEKLVDEFSQAGFHCVCYQTDESHPTTAYLIRKQREIRRDHKEFAIDDIEQFSWIDPVQKALEQTDEDQRIWLSSMKVRDNGIVGLGLCLREEEGARYNRVRTLANTSLDMTPFVIEKSELDAVKVHDLHSNCYRDGKWGSFRHEVTKEDDVLSYRMCGHAYVQTLVRGDLSTLRFVESVNQYYYEFDIPENIHLVEIYYAPLNFRDVMLSTGRLTVDAIPGPAADQDNLLGLEFVGKLPCGKRVMGVLTGKGLATSVIVHQKNLFDIPDDWTMEEASTVPVSYNTAYYALIVRGQLTKGQSVLIHSGTGGVGQAAISIALSLGVQVYVTVGNKQKRQFLIERFPELNPRHIFFSHTSDFEHGIMKATKGVGVTAVLNSLSEEKLQASVRCLEMHGKFLEIGKFDLATNSKLGMNVFLKNVTFHGILLDSLFLDNDVDWYKTRALFSEGMRSGVVRPLPNVMYAVNKMEEAFRFMSSGKHIGKVVLQIRAETPGDLTPPKPVQVKAVCRSICHPKHVYVVTGGLGGFGLELANWLVNRGCSRLVLTSRRGVQNGYQARYITTWESRGVEVVIDKSDISTIAGAESLIQRSLKMGAVGGLFHLAMVLRDTLFEEQSAANFKQAAEMKYMGTKNLDQTTRKYCDLHLKWFVVFSSISSGRGNSGQTNYGWANSSMERIIEQRRHDGFPGNAIQWGAVGDVGVVIDMMKGDNNTVVSGTLPQRMSSCLQSLDTFLMWDHPIVSSYVRAETGKKLHDGSGNVLEKIARIVGISDVNDMDLNANLSDLGIDSLMGVEIRQVLERDHDIVLSMKEIRTMTLGDLNKMAAGEQIAIRSQSKAADSKEDKQTLERQMNTLFKLRVDVNDLLTTDQIVRINGVADSSERVFFVHSIEGIASVLKKLGDLILAPSFCLQVTQDTPMDTIESCAGHYVKVLKSVQPEGPYRLVGYSFGAPIAFEMAYQLEQEGTMTDLVLLDGSHYYMQTYREAYRLAYDIKDPDLTNNPIFETEILCALGGRFVNFDYESKRLEMMKLTDWSSRVQTMTNEVMTSGLFKKTETFVWACESLRQKYLAIDKYNPQKKLTGDVTLIRAHQTTPGAKITDFGGDYGLGEVITGKVHIHPVDGDHDSMVQGVNSKNTAELINAKYNFR